MAFPPLLFLMAVVCPAGDELTEYQNRFVTGNVNFESGRMVAVDQGVAVVGDILGNGIELNAGTATVWTESEGVWSQETTLFANNGQNGDQFGAAVDIEGDRIAVGASQVFDGSAVFGVAYVFERSTSGAWEQVAELVDPHGAAGDKFAQSVALSGDHLLVGASGAGSNGRAVAYTRSVSGAWEYESHLQLGAGQSFGTSVEVDGVTAAVAAPGGQGRVALFERQSGGWALDQVIFDPTPESGGAFGTSLDLDGDRVVAGSANLNGNEGRVEVFRRSPSTWLHEGTLTQPAPAPLVGFGRRAAIQGDLLAVASIDADSPLQPDESTGLLYLYRYQNDAWVYVGIVDPAEDYGGAFDFGVWIDMSEDHLIAFDRQSLVNPSWIMLFERAALASLEDRTHPNNVDSLTTSAPVLGEPWSVKLKLDVQLLHTGFLMFSAGPEEVPLANGSVLLVDLGPGQLLSTLGPYTPQAATLSLQLPCDAALAGLCLSIQGILIEPTGAFDLSNAADVCFGI